MKCEVCDQIFNNANTFRSHKSRLANLGLCKRRADKKKASELVAKMDAKDLVEAIEQKQKNDKNEESLEDLKQMIGKLTSKIDYQNSKIDSLKEMMVDMQNNPRLLVICNKLYPLEQLNLRNPEFKPVLEILDKELPEYPNLGNERTGVIHAKAVKTLNSIQPTAVQEGETVFFKSDNVLSKDTNFTTTRAFIDAIRELGYEYAQKASEDLKSERESDRLFKKEILLNANKNAIPNLNDI
jgi:flagellar motor protein MotB